MKAEPFFSLGDGGGSPSSGGATHGGRYHSPV